MKLIFLQCNIYHTRDSREEDLWIAVSLENIIDLSAILNFLMKRKSCIGLKYDAKLNK